MIYGIGTDICDVRRIRTSLERQGQRFAAKILTDNELEIWQQRSTRSPERGILYLATRFSVKEAFSKAIGLGMTQPMSWRLCEIASLPDGDVQAGKPALVLHGDLKAWFDQRSLRAHVSMSDEADYVATFCVVEVLATS